MLHAHYRNMSVKAKSVNFISFEFLFSFTNVKSNYIKTDKLEYL